MASREIRQLSIQRLGEHLNARAVLFTALIVIATSTVAVYSEPYTGLVASALVFVLGVMAAGALYGLLMALVAALAAFLIYNFFLTEPFLSFRMATSRDAAPLVAFNLAALIAGMMAGRLQDRARAAQRSNLQLASLLDASEALQSAVRPIDIASQLAGNAPLRVFRAREGRLEPLGEATMPWWDIATKLWKSNRPTLSEEGMIAVLLRGSTGPIGVLVVSREDGDEGITQPAYLTALANLLGLALERAQLSETITEARAAARSEELKTALLSSVSHDFRTPLAAISASASSLIDYRDHIDASTRDQLLRSIVDECEWLNRYTANLLEMSKLQAGAAVSHAQVLEAADILASALQRVRPRLGARQVERSWPRVPILVRVDASLFELVLVNVLDNAIAYSDDGTRIEVTLTEDGPNAVIDIRDEGSGIPPEDLGRVFDRFYRVARSDKGPRGSGLGLAIAKGFVEAFGGHISAAVPGIGERGTHISIRLPMAEGSSS